MSKLSISSELQENLPASSFACRSHVTSHDFPKGRACLQAGRSLSYIFPGLSLRLKVAGYMLLVGRELSNWGLLFSIKVAGSHAHSSQGKSPALGFLMTAMFSLFTFKHTVCLSENIMFI